MGKLIAVYGNNGSGKSTIASNLAFALSKQFLTGIIGLNTNYGSIQHFFGMRIENDKNLRNIILSNGLDDIAKNFTQHPTQTNLFVLSMPNEDDCLKLADTSIGLDSSTAINIVVTLKEKFDYLIVDCTNDVNDPLSIYSLVYSNKVINSIKPTLQGLSFLNSYKSLFEALKVYQDRIINVSNSDKNTIGLARFEKIANIKFDVALPFDKKVEISESEGIPISQSMKKSKSWFKEDYLSNLKILLSLVQGGNIVGKV